MEAVATMNVFAALFGIFRQHGLVHMLREQKPLRGFGLTATMLAIVGGLFYGVAMGIGLGLDTALKDGIKIGLIVAGALLIAMPIFGLAYRLLGREEPIGQVVIVPLTFIVSSALSMAVAAPIVFLLSILAGISPNAIYIHIVIIDVALLVGLYVAGTLVYHGFTSERSRLVAPNAISFVLLGVAIVVLVLFFSPFLLPYRTFSYGTDMLKDRIGIGVGAKASQALSAAATSEQLSYHFQAINERGDIERDYTITRVRDDYLATVTLHAVPGEELLRERQIWILGNTGYTDFAAGRVNTVAPADLTTLIAPAMPEAAFRLHESFASASWRGLESSNAYLLIGTAPDGRQITLNLDPGTLRLTSLLIGHADRGVHAQVRIDAIGQATQSRDDIEASLRRATVLGSIDRSDATLQNIVQQDAFFVARIPRTWRAGSWDIQQHHMALVADCGLSECPSLTITTFDLVKDKDANGYATDLRASLGRQPQYRTIIGKPSSDTQTAVIEYLADRTVKGQIETTHHLEYIFVGELWRYHLDFSAPEEQFENNRRLFESLASLFVYLKAAE